MTCTIDRNKLAEAMAAVVKVTGGAEYHPVWQCARIQVVKGHLVLNATDGVIWLNLSFEASGEMGPVCVSAGRFRDAVASLSGELVGLKSEGGKLLLFAGKGKRSLATVATEEFPTREFNAASTFTLSAETLKDAAAFALPHIADIEDSTRNHVAALFLFSRAGRLKALGTDGSELALIDLGEAPGEMEVPLPGRVADLATSLVHGDVELGLSERAVEFRWLGGTIIGPMLENPSPLDRLMTHVEDKLAFSGVRGEDQEPFVVGLEAKAFLAALRGVRGLGDTDSASRGKRIKLSLNGLASLSTSSFEGSAEEEFPADLEGAREMEIGFSSTRMERVLRGFGDRTLTMTLRDPAAPMKFEAAGLPDRVALLFPMRV
jgi:DNA polymerase III sliding clamp (beta) subunit (PCNA family)